MSIVCCPSASAAVQAVKTGVGAVGGGACGGRYCDIRFGGSGGGFGGFFDAGQDVGADQIAEDVSHAGGLPPVGVAAFDAAAARVYVAAGLPDDGVTLAAAGHADGAHDAFFAGAGFEPAGEVAGAVGVVGGDVEGGQAFGALQAAMGAVFPVGDVPAEYSDAGVVVDAVALGGDAFNPWQIG